MGILLFFILLVFSIDAQKKYWLPVISPYNLKSDERYTKYLPARVKALRREINNNGLTQAINLIRDDRDLESYLFILSVDKPEKLLAYSRQPQLFDKTAAELQKLISSSPGLDSKYNVSVVFDRWISTARKGDTYIPYFWRFDNNESVDIQVAYVSLLNLDGGEYVVGAAVFVKSVPDHIVLPHRVKTMLAHFNGKNMDDFLKLIDNDPIKDLYFFINMEEPPYREIANGGSPELIGLTAEMEQKKLLPNCAEDACSFTKLYQRMAYQNKLGGGYVAYNWRALPTDPVKLEVAYIQPITYKKTKMIFGTGYTPFNFPERLITQLPQAVDNAIKLINEVGLDNTISMLKKTNNKKLYLFIIEQDSPYKSVLDIIGGLEASADVATVYAKKMVPEYAVDYVRFRGEMSRFAQEEGGFYAYEYKTPIPEVPDMLKIAYIKPFIFNGTNYFVGATYQTLD